MKWPTVKTYLRKTSQFSLVSKFLQQTFTAYLTALIALCSMLYNRKTHMSGSLY